MTRTGEIRCPFCNKRLFDVENLDINPGGIIEIRCKCKETVLLTASGLTLKDITS